MNETLITLQGWLGTNVTLRRAGDVPVASFRVACTPRRFNRRTETWSDATTQWFTVNAWRGLAENCATSLQSGDPVVVHGRLTVSTWINANNVEVTCFEVEADHVGHDLSRGSSQFTKPPKRESADAGQDTSQDTGQDTGQDAA